MTRRHWSEHLEKMVHCYECQCDLYVDLDSCDELEDLFCEECEEARKHEDCEDHPCADCLSRAIDRATDFYELQQDITEERAL